MPDSANNSRRPMCFAIVRLAFILLVAASVSSAAGQAITNLQELTQTVETERRVHRPIELEATVCAASRPKVGVLIVQDKTGVELLQIGDFGRVILPGEQIYIHGEYDLLRKREMGIELTATPVVDNDGTHYRRVSSGSATFKAGMIPLRLDCYNSSRDFNLEVYCFLSDQPTNNLITSNLWHEVVDASGRTNYSRGLCAECYEGYWEAVPNFELLQPVKRGIVGNFDLGFKTRDQWVGIRFTGYLKLPKDAQYDFREQSEEGSLWFLNESKLQAVHRGDTNVPTPCPGFYGQEMDSLTQRLWTTIEGRVGFVAKKGEGLEFDLHSDRDVIPVRIADAGGLELVRLRNCRVKVTGVGCPVLTADQRVVLGKLFAASTNEIQIIDEASGSEPSLPITSVGQVQSLPIADARRALPVRIRGVVTEARNFRTERWMSLQDDTRGIFVSLTIVSNTFPAFGEYWEVQGHSGAGDFAPVVIADKMTLLGDGILPEPTRPTWTELLNGSMDVQWAELQGLVTGVQSNRFTLLLPNGRLEVQMDGYDELELKPFLKTVARIRGVLYALWNADTREVRVGSVLMRNATISVDIPAPADPFDAVAKTPRELLLFDAASHGVPPREGARANHLCGRDAAFSGT